MTVPAADRARALAFVGRVPSRSGVVLELRANGAKLAGADLDAVLAKAVARERVEVEVDLLAYEQGARDAGGRRVPNRKGVRVSPAALDALARSGVGTPFMRDHDAGNSLAKGGEIVASKLELGANGYARIVQTARIVEPAAVERAARGLLSAVSIHAAPTAGSTITCTACAAPAFCEPGAKCYHLPLDVVTDAAGAETTVEWEFSGAELLETSECPIPAVQSAGTMSPVRAMLALAAFPQENQMKITPALAAKLKIAATAGDDEIIAAAERTCAELETATARLAIVDGERTALAAQVAGFVAAEKVAAKAKFSSDAVRSGRIALADVPVWERLYDADPTAAAEEMAKRAAGAGSPVGRAAQSDPALAAPAPGEKPVYTKAGVLAPLAGETREAYQARKKAIAMATAQGGN